jgi:hypothetical protein
MNRALGVVAVIASVASVGHAFGQQRPDFSGTWTYDAAHSSKTSRGVSVNGVDRSTTPIDVDKPPSPALGNDFTAKQDAKTLTLELTLTRQTGDSDPFKDSRLKYQQDLYSRTIDGARGDNNTAAGTVHYSSVDALEGSESHNKIPPMTSGEPELEFVSTAAWNGGTLVITTTWVPPNPTPTPRPSTTRSFRLDSDGYLIVETTTTMVGGPWTYTTAYARKR